MSERKIYYQIIGKGEPLVFMHGNGEDSNVFVNQIEYFKNKYQLILIDTIMHGKSNNSFDEYNFYDLALDVLNVLNKENINKANFIGFSDGANILFHIGILNSDIIKKGIAISGNINTKALDKTLAKAIKKAYLREKSLKSEKYYFLHLMQKEPNLKFKDLHKITSPILVLAGGDDVILEKHTKRIAKNIKDSTLLIVPEFDHFAITKESEKINKIIESYLND